jgi:hypothetical protein
MATGQLIESASVRVKARDGTAQDGLDYFFSSETLTFSNNQKSSQVTLRLADDQYFSNGKNFYLDIVSVKNASLGIATIKIDIQENDPRVVYDESSLIKEPQLFNEDRLLFGATSLELADYDNDGLQDLAITSYGGGELILYNHYDFSTKSFSKDIVFHSLSNAVFVEFADIDNDEDLDLIATAFSGNEVVLLVNEGAVEDAPYWRPIKVDEQVAGPISARVADINGDSSPDIVVAAYWEDSIVMYENVSPQGLSVKWAKRIIDGNASKPHDIVIVDLDQDSHYEILSANYGSNSLSLYSYNLEEKSGWEKVTVDADISGPTSVAAFDYDLDGDLEIIATSYLGDYVSLYEYDHSVMAWRKRIIANEIDAPFDVEIEDLNANGIEEIIVASYLAQKDEEDGKDNAYSILEQEQASTEWSRRVLAEHLHGAHEIKPRDFDGDGLIDILAAVPYYNEIKIFKARLNSQPAN